MEALGELVSGQIHPEIEIFIFKGRELEEDELYRRLDLDCVYTNHDRVLYLAVKKNRKIYDAYQENPQEYRDVVAKWAQGSSRHRS